MSINEIVADSVHRCDQSAKERQVAIVPSLAMPARDGAAPMVLGDPDLLGAVIDNLIRNSIRFAAITVYNIFESFVGQFFSQVRLVKQSNDRVSKILGGISKESGVLVLQVNAFTT